MSEPIESFLKSLRDTIIQSFEAFEPIAKIKRKEWDFSKTGGGEMSVIRGDVFEKAAVNWSGVAGDQFPTDDAHGPFYATGVSLITHMTNPKAPTVHMNIRYIKTQDQYWFGGGYDLTPMGFPFVEDTEHFHSIAKSTLDPFGTHLYPDFKKNAEDYFFIPHYNKQRGVGGIFFDHFNSGDFEKDLSMWKQIGTTFLDSIIPIYNRRCDASYTDADKELQLKLRAHYVEFNLLYDRGTRFGFNSGGNPEAILCSMPPLVKW